MRHKLAYTSLVFILLFIAYYFACIIYNNLYSNALRFKEHKTDLVYQQCQKMHQPKDLKTVRVLVISGGGINGIIPLAFLNYIEQKTHRPIHELFDLFVATSTGSLIVTLLNAPDANGQYLNASTVLDDYSNNAKEFLSPNHWRNLFTMYGFLGPRLDIHKIYQGLQKTSLAHQAFFQLNKDIVFTNTQLEGLSLTLLKNWDCREPRNYSPLPEVLTSTTAMPLVFSPVYFINDQGQKRTYADGAIYSNRPFLEAIDLAKERNPKLQKIVLVFMSTGRQLRIPEHWDSSSFDHWGLLKWFEPVIKIMFTAQQYEAHEGISTLLEYVSPKNLQYFHFNANWHNDPLDVSDANINALKAAAMGAVKDNQKQLDDLIQELNLDH